jgi:hypothetical protein
MMADYAAGDTKAIAAAHTEDAIMLRRSARRECPAKRERVP